MANIYVMEKFFISDQKGNNIERGRERGVIMSFLSCIFVKFDFIYFSGRSSGVILVYLGTIMDEVTH